MNYPMIGSRAQKRGLFPRKKKMKETEKREWRKDYTDYELYPELEDETIGPQWVLDIINESKHD